MRQKLDNAKLERGRILTGDYASKPGAMHGAFRIFGPTGSALAIMSSGDGDHEFGWEHVSVSLQHRTPNWQEMCFVKDLFWSDEECVVQFHPPKSVYVDCHPNCLHLWKPIGATLSMPPSILVGPKTVEET